MFPSYMHLSQDSFIIIPNGRHAKIHHVGTIQLTPSLTLYNALHVPNFHYNLFSASKFAKQLAAHVVFTPSTCYIQDPSMKHRLEIGREIGGLYLVDKASCNSRLASSSFRPNSKSIFSFSYLLPPLELRHCRLGHISFDNMKHIAVIPSWKAKPTSICQVCHQAKQHRSPFPVSASCTSYIFEMLHVDLWDPCAHPTYNDYKYFITIVDDYSRVTWTHLLSHKSNAFPFLNLLFLSSILNFKEMLRSFVLIMARNFQIIQP